MKNALIVLLSLLLLGLVSQAQTLSQHPSTAWSGKRIENGLSAAKPATVNDCPAFGMEYFWDDNLGIWQHFRRYVYSYWPSGFLMEERTEIWNGNSYTPEGRTLSEFDGVVWGNCWYSWQGNAWQPTDSYAVTFDSQLIPLTSFAFQQSQGQWDTVYGQRQIYVPNPSLPLYTDGEVWRSNNPVWTLENHTEYHYSIPTEWDTATYFQVNGANLVPDYRQIVHQWHDFATTKYVRATFQEILGNSWTTTVRDSMHHGPFGSYVSVSESSLDGITWSDPSRYEVGFDTLRHQTLVMAQNWVNGTWVTDFGTSFDYVYDAQWHRERIYQSEFTDGSFVLGKRIDFLSQLTSRDDVVDEGVVVSTYPNPCTDVVRFQLGNEIQGTVAVQLYDLQGRLRVGTVSEVSLGQTMDLPLAHQLEAGTYCYRLQSQSGEAVGKIVVAR
jgi:hypothetical protein